MNSIFFSVTTLNSVIQQRSKKYFMTSFHFNRKNTLTLSNKKCIESSVDTHVIILKRLYKTIMTRNLLELKHLQSCSPDSM